MDENELWCIILVSSTNKELSFQEGEAFIKIQRETRTKENLTGLIIYANGNSLSLIEGPKNKVKSHYEIIQKFSIHHNLIKIFDKSINNRSFEDYPLAIKVIQPDLFKKLDSFQSSDQNEYFEEFLTMGDPISKIVRDFIKNNT